MAELVEFALLLTLRRCVTHSFAFLAMRHVIQWAKVFLSHATAQRRNVKAQVLGEMAMGMLTVTGLTGFSAKNTPFDDKGAIFYCGLHLIP